MNLNEAVAFYKLDLIKSEKLPEIASDALEASYDSPSLRLRAGELNPIMSTVGPMFEKTITELNISIPTKRGAYFIVAKYYSNKIISGELSPYDGAKIIWEKVTLEEDSPEELSAFAGAASEIEDLPLRYSLLPFIANKYIKKYEKGSLELARDIVADKYS